MAITVHALDVLIGRVSRIETVRSPVRPSSSSPVIPPSDRQTVRSRAPCFGVLYLAVGEGNQ